MVILEGEIDTASAPRVASRLSAGLAAAVRRLDIDLSAVTFIDSSGLTVLIVAARQAEVTGVEFHIVAASAAVRRTVALSGLGETLGVSEEELS